MHFQSIRMFKDGARPAAGDRTARREQAAVRSNSSEATLPDQVNQRKRRCRIELSEAAHFEFSDPDDPIACFERLNERAKWIARSVQDAVSALWIVEAIPPRASEVQRRNVVQMSAKKILPGPVLQAA